MRSLVIGLVSIMGVGLHNVAFAQTCYETMVQSPTPFMGNTGEVLKLADGSMWEVKYGFAYLYEYHPAVLVCPKSGKLMVKSRTIDIQAISSGSSVDKAVQTVIESTIVSDFQGLDTGNIYRLANGQIWEQTESWIWVWVWVSPSVTIYPASGGYKMKVENIEHPVLVRRIK